MPDILDELAAADDATLSEKFGFAAKLADAKTTLTELSALPAGPKRDQAVTRVTEMLTPNVYPSEFNYILERAKRPDKSAGPSQLVSDCGCDVPDCD